MSLFKKIFKTSSEETDSKEKLDDKSPYAPDVNLPIDEQFTFNFKANGGKFIYCENLSEISENLIKLAAHKGRGFLEIRVNKGSRENLGRPTTTPKENKLDFQEFLSK